MPHPQSTYLAIEALGQYARHKARDLSPFLLRTFRGSDSGQQLVYSSFRYGPTGRHIGKPDAMMDKTGHTTRKERKVLPLYFPYKFKPAFCQMIGFVGASRGDSAVFCKLS